MLSNRQNGIIRKKIDGDFEEIWKRLLDIVAAEKIPVFAVIDHKSNALQVGLDMTDARVLIFGNPAVGTVLMQSNPEIALDLPLKFLVWKSSDGVILSWNSPTWLAERFEMNPNMEVVKKINNLLEKLSDIIAAV
ncbi:DUF302 domain-containing protein [Taurinivorans muris]|uniref:DUF302 domain-containing protein n=1 Tax=Taurinivorans muris TaxID=2787751 RepID=A0ABY5Y1S2_9BACT|nr:DUF302 domain-containing protein [Desulfovibrionaceae bacterium LT0009]